MRAHWSVIKNDLAYAKPYWNYEDLGVFFLILVLFRSVLRLLVRTHLLPRSELTNPSVGLQFGIVAFLSLAFYLVLKLRHHQPVFRPLGWVLPRTTYIGVGALGGISLALGVALLSRQQLPSLTSQKAPPRAPFPFNTLAKSVTTTHDEPATQVRKTPDLARPDAYNLSTEV